MADVENNEVAEVVTQDQNHEMPSDQAQNKIVEVPKEESRQDRNWRAMSEKQRQLEQELKMQREMNEKLLQLQLANQTPQKPEVDELDQLSDSEYLPKGQVKKLVQKEKDQIVKQTLEEVERRYQQREQSQFMDKLKRQFSDFEQVVNPETISLLETNDPELAATIADLKDPYKIGIQSYKYIKAMNLASEVPQARRAKEVEKKLAQNEKTVQTPQAYEKRPLAQAFVMSESEKSKLYEEMMGYARQSGFSY